MKVRQRRRWKSNGDTVREKIWIEGGRYQYNDFIHLMCFIHRLGTKAYIIL
jgi:hypothetical protein